MIYKSNMNNTVWSDKKKSWSMCVGESDDKIERERDRESGLIMIDWLACHAILLFIPLHAVLYISHSLSSTFYLSFYLCLSLPIIIPGSLSVPFLDLSCIFPLSIICPVCSGLSLSCLYPVSVPI